MSGVLGYVPPLGTVHSALSCVTDAAGQTVCSGGTSAGFFAGLGILVFVYLAFAVIGIIAAVKVVTKAGYSGWWVLVCFVPFVGTVFVLIFAFSTWPVTRELETLRAQVVGSGAYGPGRYGGGSGPGLAPGPMPQGPGAPSEVAALDVAIPSFGQVLRGEADPAEAVHPGASPTPTLAHSTPPPTEQPAAGWYASPGGPAGQLRYWDGTRWTDHVH